MNMTMEVPRDTARPLLWTLAEARHQLGDCSERTIYRLAAAGHLDLVRVGSSARITEESLRRYVASLARADIKAEPPRRKPD